MHFTDTRVAGAWIIYPSPHHDERGRFMRMWCAREFEERGIHFLPVQANMQFSRRKGTVRGLHLQVARALEAKLVRCTRGAIFDVAVDPGPSSLSFGEWCSVELSAENGRMLYVPEHCAHGYPSIEENSEAMYLTSAFYAPESCRGTRFDDPAFGIQWPLPVSAISERDRKWPLIQWDRTFLRGEEFMPLPPATAERIAKSSLFPVLARQQMRHCQQRPSATEHATGTAFPPQSLADTERSGGSDQSTAPVERVCSMRPRPSRPQARAKTAPRTVISCHAAHHS